MNGTIKEIDEKSFDQLLKSAQKLVIVEFFTNSCPNCAAIAPTYKMLAQELWQYAEFTRVNAEHAPVLAAKFGVFGVPTFKFYCKGRPIGEVVGAINGTLLRNSIKDMLRHRQECVSKATPIRFEIDGYG